MERLDIILDMQTIMSDRSYCNDSINAVVLSSDRDCVAHLVCIQREDMEGMKLALQETTSERYAEIVRKWRLFKLGSNSLNATSATVIVRFLDFALVSFAGAHLESFDQHYLSRCESEFVLGESLVLRRRSLKCLDGYLNHCPVWVFEEINASGGMRREDSLYLSTTMAQFHQIWGPVWATSLKHELSHSREDVSSKFTQRFCVGLGYIIPWTRALDEPQPLDNETFAHWADEEADVQDDAVFEIVSSHSQLLIGAGPRLKVNDDCTFTTDECTSRLRRRNCLRSYRTSRSSKVRDNQPVNVSLSSFGLGGSYSEQYKIRQGASLKEDILAAWIHQT